MKKDLFIGIDIGTFETKGVIVNAAHEIIASHAELHTIENPRPQYFEMDAEAVWWGDFCKVTHALIEKTGIDPARIAGVGSSTLGCDCLPVDQNCRPLRKAILYGIDARSDQQIAFLKQYYGEAKVRAMFGGRMCSDDIAPKILWIKENEPEVYAKTYKFLTGSSFITAKLTGEYVIDHFLAKSSFIPLYSLDGSIDEQQCTLFCRPDQLARCALVTDIAGGVTREAARQTGIPEGTPVIVGTGDSTAEAISVGLVEPGSLLCQFGSTLFFYYCTDHYVSDPRVHSSIFTVPDTYCIAAGTNAAGALTRWIRDTFYFDALECERNGGENAYSVMARCADEIKPGSDGLIMLPYLYGERSPINDPKACGMFFGLNGSHTRHHLNRAALESVGYSAYQHIQLFRSLGLPVETMNVVGGGTKNRTWMQLVADILGIPLKVAKSWQSASYGDAMMAKIGTGVLQDFVALKNAIPENETIMPNAENRAIYEPISKFYDELYQINRDLMHRLHAYRSELTR